MGNKRRKRRRRFTDHTGGAQVDPSILRAGHAAHQLAVSVCAVALAAVARGDTRQAGAAVATFLYSSRSPVVRVGRHNALISVLLDLAARQTRERGGGSGEGVIFALEPEPDASPARRAVMMAIGYHTAGDAPAALDALLAHKLAQGGPDGLVALIGELMLITAHLITGDVEVITLPWPGTGDLS